MSGTVQHGWGGERGKYPTPIPIPSSFFYISPPPPTSYPICPMFPYPKQTPIYPPLHMLILATKDHQLPGCFGLPFTLIIIAAWDAGDLWILAFSFRTNCKPLWISASAKRPKCKWKKRNTKDVEKAEASEDRDATRSYKRGLHFVTGAWARRHRGSRAQAVFSPRAACLPGRRGHDVEALLNSMMSEQKRKEKYSSMWPPTTAPSRTVKPRADASLRDERGGAGSSFPHWLCISPRVNPHPSV